MTRYAKLDLHPSPLPSRRMEFGMKSLDWHAVGTLTCAQCKPSSIWFSAFTFTPRPHPHRWHARFTHRHLLLPHLLPPASGMPPPPLGLPWGCLRTAGATALLLSQVDLDVICLIRRWRSDKMLHYLHVQASFDEGLCLTHAFCRMYTLILNQLVPQ